MARTTQELVAGVLTPAEMNDENDDLEPFITTANILVTRCCSTKVNVDGVLVYGAADLEIIERWLAAHFYKIPNPANLKERVSRDAENTIESKVDLGLDVTRWGQMAKVLDTAGGLSEADSQTNKRGWGAYWLGTRPEDTQRRAYGRRGN